MGGAGQLGVRRGGAAALALAASVPAAFFLAGLAGYVLPWGQMQFWLASLLVGGADDAFVTPARIVPEWYVLPFYAMLRSVTFGLGPVDTKVLGVVVALAGALVLGLAMPLGLLRSRVARLSSLAWASLAAGLTALAVLGLLGAQPAEGFVPVASLVLTATYFAALLAFGVLASRARPAATPALQVST